MKTAKIVLGCVILVAVVIFGIVNYTQLECLKEQLEKAESASDNVGAVIGNPAEVENIDPNAPLTAGVCNEANNFECGRGLSCVEGKCVVETATADKSGKIAAVEQLAKTDHDCVDLNGKFLPAGTLCGDQTDDICDNPDTCNGSGSCQPNIEPTTVVCRVMAGPCDVTEFCSGDGACPTDRFSKPNAKKSCTGTSASQYSK